MDVWVREGPFPEARAGEREDEEINGASFAL